MFRGIPQDQFEVNLDMMETLGENAVSTAGFSLPRDDDTFRFSRHLQWDRTDANFASFVRSESRVATRRGGSNEVSFYRLVPRPNPSRKFFDWVGKGVDCHTLSKSIFKRPVMSVPRFKIGDQAHLHVWDSDPRTWFSHAQLVASHLFAGVRKHEADLNDSLEYLIRQPPRSGSPSSLNSYRWRRRKDRS